MGATGGRGYNEVTKQYGLTDKNRIRINEKISNHRCQLSPDATREEGKGDGT